MIAQTIEQMLKPPRRWARYVDQPEGSEGEHDRDEVAAMLTKIRLNGGGMVRLVGYTDPPETWAIGTGGTPDRPAAITAPTSLIRQMVAEDLLRIGFSPLSFNEAASIYETVPGGVTMTGKGIARRD